MEEKLANVQISMIFLLFEYIIYFPLLQNLPENLLNFDECLFPFET